MKLSSVEAFLEEVASRPLVKRSSSKGRLFFAMDATASRQMTWDRAAHIQTEMFVETAKLGGLEVQLGFFRGFDEFKVSQWTSDPERLLSIMKSVNCMAGQTQIEKVLKHALNQTKKFKLDAVVYVGDSMEEDIDNLGQSAGNLGMYGVPVFMFQEGHDPITNIAYEEVAKLSGGACVSFDLGSVGVLKDLLTAVAVFTAGGRQALENMSFPGRQDVKKLIQKIGKK